jgi:hypothetical protein
MISLDWESPNQLRGFTQSKMPLKGEEEEEDVYKFDIITYHKIEGQYFQFAIETEDIPYINRGDEDEYYPLFKIRENLWINKEEWRTSTVDTDRGYHYCSSVNTLGTLDLVIKDNISGKKKAVIQIDIQPSIENFNFEELKNDFEGDLWSLITADHAKVRTSKHEINWKGTPVTFLNTRLVISFLDAFERVHKKPKKELINAIHYTSSDKVRPIPLTYRKIATTGKSDSLPSRGYTESFDNYENRAVCQMLFWVDQLVNKNIQFANLQKKRILRQIDTIQQQIKELEQPQKVDPVVIEQEIAKQEAFYEKYKQDWERNKEEVLRAYNNEDCTDISVVKIIGDTHSPKRFWVKKGETFGLMYFNMDMDKIITPYQQQTIILQSRCTTHTDHHAGGHPKFYINGISSIELTGTIYEKVIDRKKSHYATLANNNWDLFSTLTLFEQEKLNNERKHQVQTLSKKQTILEAQKHQILQLIKELETIRPDISKRLNSDFVRSINWKNFTRFKPSMTFLQNRIYKNTYITFQRLVEESIGDISVFELYEQLVSYGVREIPQVYELWSLVRIIKCLEEEYHLKPKPADLKLLLQALSPANNILKNHCEINFTHKLAERSVTLLYQ